MRTSVVAKTVSYLVEMVSRSLAIAIPFVADWNERGASSRARSRILLPTLTVADNTASIQRDAMFQRSNHIGVPMERFG
jgi:hypothetical protein